MEEGPECTSSGPSSHPYSAECVEKLSKKSLGGVSSVGIAAITRRNGPILPASGPPGTLVLELTGVFRQFRKVNSANFASAPAAPVASKHCGRRPPSDTCRPQKTNRPL